MAKLYGVVSTSTVWGVVGGLAMAINAFPSHALAAPYVADALPRRFQTTQTPMLQTEPSLFTTGAVLIRRTQEALPPPSEAEETVRLQGLAAVAAQQAASQVAGDVLTEATNRATTIAEDIAAQKAEEAKHTALSELNQFKNTLTATESRLTAVAQSSAAQSAAALAAGTSVQSTQMQALKAQNQALQSQLTGLQTTQQAVANTLQNQVVTSQQATQSQLVSLQNNQEIVANTLQNQMATSQQATQSQLAALQNTQQANTQQLQAQIAMGQQAQQLALAGLQDYTQVQLATIAAETSRTITQLAEQTQQSSAKMRFQTAQQLARIQSQAASNAQLLSMATAEQIGQAVLAYQQQTDQRILTPQQVAAIANQSVQDAAPQVRAIALQSLKDSQDYLRALTRDAVQESDPAMAQALANAARNVITKDDQVVFAIRKAVNEALSQPEILLSSAGPRTELGPDHGLAATNISDTAIDASGLGVSAILSALEPAAGGTRTSRTTAQLPLIKNPYASVTKARQRQDWMDLRQYRVAVHTDNLTLPDMLDSILKQATPYTGPWQVRWKLTPDNQDLLKETFSLDAETTFEEFINYLAQYIMNDRGVKLGFALFDQERLIVVSD